MRQSSPVTLAMVMALRLSAALLALALIGVHPAQAVPAFSVQTGQPCQSCHVGGFGPQLTPFGREFKLKGYTQRAGKWNVPLSMMGIASYVHTRKAQASEPTPDYSRNDNFSLDQISLFLAGGVGSHFGGFVQGTYDGVARQFAWDNLDLRAVTTTQIKGADVVLGLTLNNSPTVQDVWNTLPAWGYPYTSSSLAPHPAAAPLLAGGFAQKVLGLSGYAWIDSKFYVEAGAYTGPKAGTLAALGSDPFAPGELSGLAPYGRIAFSHALAGGTAEVGAFAMRAHLFPARDHSTGQTDRYTDLGLDASFIQARANTDVFTLNARYTHEAQSLDATFLLGGADHANNRLEDFRIDASYYRRNRIGGTVGFFDTFGTSDALLYSGSPVFKPDSTGVTFQLDGTPWGGGGSPLGARFNIRTGVQYTLYTQFDGRGTNYDGTGRNASDNNTVRIFGWIAY